MTTRTNTMNQGPRWCFLSFAVIGLLGLAACSAAGPTDESAYGQDPSEELGDPGTDPQDPGSSATPPGSEPTTGKSYSDLSTDELEQIQLLRNAITQGLVLGKFSIADELNIVLGDKGVTERYAASLETGVDYAPPAAASCPFMSTYEPGQSLDCRALVTRATASAYAHLSALKATNPLGVQFDSNREESEFWYDEGILTGIDNEAVLALSHIRGAKLCDQVPEEAQSAYEAGVEAGRSRYVIELNKRLVEAGYSMQYPNNIQQIQQCQADFSLLVPARSRALDGLEVYAEDNPLCGDFQPQTVEDVSRRDEVEKQYLEGLERGIDTEHSLAEERLFEVVPCNVGDPLVLDIEGNGVALQSLESSSARFDLFGTGHIVPLAWIQGDDALLVRDGNGNGMIDSGRELFGNFIGDSGYNEVPSGFDHLALHDSNNDGIIDAADPVFAELELWQDTDGDGVSQPGELHSLASLGVAAIHTGYTGAGQADTQLSHKGSFLRTTEGADAVGSASGDIYDAWLRHGRTRIW